VLAPEVTPGGAADPRLERSRISAELRRGWRAVAGHDYQAALAAFAAAVARAPAAADGYHGRGWTRHLLEDDVAAIADLDRAIARAPWVGVYFNDRGVARLGRRQLDAALADFDLALARLPRPRLDLEATERVPQERPGPEGAGVPWAVYLFGNRGLAWALRGDAARALSEFARALALPQGGIVHGDRGAMYWWLQHDEEHALAELTLAIKAGAPQAPVVRGALLLAQGKLEEARADLRHARERDPRDPYAALWSFLATRLAGDPVAAEEELRAFAARHLARTTEWIGSAVRLHLGTLSPEGLVAAMTHRDPIITRNRRSEGYFHLAEHWRARGEHTRARRAYEQSLSQGVRHFTEHLVAEARLRTLPRR